MSGYPVAPQPTETIFFDARRRTPPAPLHQWTLRGVLVAVAMFAIEPTIADDWWLVEPDGASTLDAVSGENGRIEVIAGGGEDATVDDIAGGIDAYRAGDYDTARTVLARFVDKPSAALNYVRAGYQQGNIGEDDLSLLNDLIDQDNGAAARMLGDIHRTGNSVPVNNDRAIAAYELAIDLGDTPSLLRLALLYDHMGEPARAIPAYEEAIAFYPDKEWRYLYLVAASEEVPLADRVSAAERLDRLALTDIQAARGAVDLYRRYTIPGADEGRSLAVAQAAFEMGAHEIGIYLASLCDDCSVDELEAIVRRSTDFSEPRSVVAALARLIEAGRNDTVAGVLSRIPGDQSSEIIEAILSDRSAGNG